jgi:hypothetical protein
MVLIPVSTLFEKYIILHETGARNVLKTQKEVASSPDNHRTFLREIILCIFLASIWEVRKI